MLIDDLLNNPARAGAAILKKQLMVEEMEITEPDLAHIRAGIAILGGGLIWDSHNVSSKYHYQIEAIAVGVD